MTDTEDEFERGYRLGNRDGIEFATEQAEARATRSPDIEQESSRGDGSANGAGNDTSTGRHLPPRLDSAASPSVTLDVPPEALDWARQLVEQGYRDEHIVTFTDDGYGYGLEHPIRCRPNLTGCILNEWLRTQMAPDREPGRYIMEWADDGPRYTEEPS